MGVPTIKESDITRSIRDLRYVKELLQFICQSACGIVPSQLWDCERTHLECCVQHAAAEICDCQDANRSTLEACAPKTTWAVAAKLALPDDPLDS